MDTLLPYQSRWHNDTSKVGMWEKSRRIGASWCDAADSVLCASKQNPVDTLYIGYNREMTVEYIQDCGMWARAFDLAATDMEESVWEDGREEIITYSIKMGSGGRIQGLSSRPRNIRGRQGKVVIDEAAFVDDLHGLIKASIALLIWGGKVRIMSSHNGEHTEFNKIVCKIREGELDYSLHATTFRQAVQQGLYRRICQVQDIAWSQEGERQWVDEIYALYGEGATEELDCIPRSDAQHYITRQMITACQNPDIPVIRLSKPSDWYLDPARDMQARQWLRDHLQPIIQAMHENRRTVIGMDFGRSADLSVVWAMQPNANKWATSFVLELRNIPFDVQRTILFHILDNVPLLHMASLDGRGNGQQLAEEAGQHSGASRIQAIMATDKWYATEIPAYRAAIETRQLTMPPGEDIILDHRRLTLINGKPKVDSGRDKGSDGKFRHGDAAVAGLLAYSAARAEMEPAYGVTVPRKPSIWTHQRRHLI